MSINKLLTVVSIALSLAACSGVTRKESTLTRSCTCDLSDIEIIHNDSICWSRAGITDDFIHWNKRALRDTLTDADQLQSQLDRIGQAGGGVLVVPEGTFVIRQTIRIPSNVALVGVSSDASILKVQMNEVYKNSQHLPPYKGNAMAFLFEKVTGASMENLCLIYSAVDFEPMDFDTFDHPWQKEVFHVEDPNTDNLFVSMVWFEKAENCKLDGCRILQSGNDPIRIRNSRHITCRDNFIDRAFNKGGGGAGYYNLINSHYCLIYKETVRRIRHLSIHLGSSYNVVYGCDLEVDVNFHNGDRGHNLVENNTIKVPNWHSWHCIGTGSESMHLPPGPYNVLYHNRTNYKGTGPEVAEQVLYFMADYYPDKTLGEGKFIETVFSKAFPNGLYNYSKLIKKVNDVFS